MMKRKKKMVQRTNHQESPEILKMRIFARSKATDLASCNYGKMAAQVAHAANGLIYTSGPHTIERWDQYHTGFGYTLVYEADEQFLLEHKKDENAFTVLDTSYPFWVEEDTVNYLVPSVTVTNIKKHGQVLCLRPEYTAFAVFMTDSQFKQAFPNAKLMKE